MSEKFRYYRLSIICLIVTIFCLTNGFTKLPFENFNLTENTVEKIGIFSFLFSLITFIYFYINLKVERIRFLYNKKEFINILEQTLELNPGWKISEKSDNYLIIETKENAETLGTSRNTIISPNMGNRIYVGLENKEFFVKSLFNLSNEHFLVLNNGESKRNEKLIINLIKSTANTV